MPALVNARNLTWITSLWKDTCDNVTSLIKFFTRFGRAWKGAVKTVTLPTYPHPPDKTNFRMPIFVTILWMLGNYTRNNETRATSRRVSPKHASTSQDSAPIDKSINDQSVAVAMPIEPPDPFVQG